MFLQLDDIQQRHATLATRMADPALMADPPQYKALAKAYKHVKALATLHEAYLGNQAEQEALRAMLSQGEDADLQELAKAELAALEVQATKLEEELKVLLLPSDPNDEKNCILELRAGTGGDEAALWVGDLFRMYQRFAEQQRWRLEVLDFTEGSAGGYKEVVANIYGEGAYGMLKYESGVHRVQRVPHTEAQGRIHTSAASVAILPEVDEVAVEIAMEHLRKDTFCSSGPGGQSVNTTYSAIRLTYSHPDLDKPIVVSCQDEKSQLKNYAKALKVLRARIFEVLMQRQQASISAARKSMVGRGDRSEKIRTYNYPQGRVTDHRIGYTQHNLPAVLGGALEGFIEALQLAEQAAKMEEEATQGGK